ncbi:Tn3 transposase DDE domain protein [Pseudovibrio axinellae]|uniref:Tn3 transposase DDE domain protein n=1 Tax=Pseudovibrio axinellae TaxID=989403 RepID=A0A165Y3C5_9HYPH|nr:Tn3 family transposase [Pseudovibrio axinellae]KZL18396.1 Tn3 transposase DDE domain protein [Pseudovibrio axinellae]SER70384.1 Transposase and inactivated derivatives, TnpA family [Pseudovibrio axinellae]
MPTRHLTADLRNTLGRFTADPTPEQLARYFHLDHSDLDVIRTLRGERNRLGCVVLLCSARFLGTFPRSEEDVPQGVIVSLCGQLDCTPDTDLSSYFDRKTQTFKRHSFLVRDKFGFTEFGNSGFAYFRLCRWLYSQYWSGEDQPGLLVERAVSWLVTNKILLPGISTLERLVGRVRERAQTRLWHRLIAGLTDEQRQPIAALFHESDPAAFAALDSLRTASKKRASTEFFRHLDRLDAVRAFDMRPIPPKGVPAVSLERLARVARTSKPSAIAALQEPRRTATVAALFYTLEATAQDDVTELAEALLADLVRDAEAANNRTRLRSLRDLDDAALVLSEMALLVISENRMPLNDWQEALFKKLPRPQIEAAMGKVAAIARPNPSKPYDELRLRWRRTRRLFFNITTRIETGSAPGGEDLAKAVSDLKSKQDWSRATMRDAPTRAIPKPWRQYVLDQNGQVIDPKAYVFATIDAWRSALKRRDVFAKPGIRYGDPRLGMLEGSRWQEAKAMVCRSLRRSLDATTELNKLSDLLDKAYLRVADRVPNNPDLRIENSEGKPRIVVTPLDRLEEPDSLKKLRPMVHALVPKAGITDIFLEVIARTGLAKAFTHLSERQARVEDFEISLCAALIAQGCNVGFEPLIRPDIPALRRSRLSWIIQNFIRPETISAANALFISAHSRLPITAHWGSGEVASADGMRFVAPSSAIHAGPNPKYFGQVRGITWYNMISDQFSGLGATVIPGTLRDSLTVLALRLEQESELEPLEVMTDSAAYSDAIFGLFWLLGYQFSPRLADIGGAKLWRIYKNADYGPFDEITDGTVNIQLISENWGDLIRLAGSLKLGHLKAASVMRMLQIKDLPTTLAKALSQLGRIIKTLHILRYVDERPFRRRILTQLNRQELRHKLGRRIHHGERGEIRKPMRHGQEEQLGVLGLALNAVIHWNATYMQEALQCISNQGMNVDPVDIARLSPIFWRHINFLGRYEFALPENVRRGELRPLNDPSSEYDF